MATMDRRPRRVIFTADDFGLSVPSNAAVERAHRDGILSTASLMVAELAAADAVERARRLPDLHVGLHVALVNGASLLGPERIPLLADGGGRLPTDQAGAGVRFFFTPGIRAQLEAEIRAQFAAFAATGLRLDHVNAHCHMHVHPTVFGMLLRVGREYGSPPIRIPRDPAAPWWLVPWLALMSARARAAGVPHNRYVGGLRDTGHMDREHVLALLRELRPGVTELYFHPALDGDTAALLDPEVMAAARAPGIEATTFAELSAR